MRSFIALFALLAACTPHPHAPAHPATVTYTIVINDGDFTEKETLAIAGAAQDWVDATYGLEIEVRVASCYDFIAERVFCLHAAHGEDMECGKPVVGCTHREGHHIAIDRWQLSLKELHLVAAHEMGHAMGLGHDVSGNAMASDVSRQAPPTCRDVHAFWWLRHERGQCRKG
jgi:hypothetical protein